MKMEIGNALMVIIQQKTMNQVNVIQILNPVTQDISVVQTLQIVQMRNGSVRNLT
jgi:hypothetical protein